MVEGGPVGSELSACLRYKVANAALEFELMSHRVKSDRSPRALECMSSPSAQVAANASPTAAVSGARSVLEVPNLIHTSAVEWSKPEIKNVIAFRATYRSAQFRYYGNFSNVLNWIGFALPTIVKHLRYVS
ncbi:hypothetical protein EVAR_99861_1 [Eumeta japonica]|uniref:Uncharacterized protein n=1 Tax=Eumeta variegata TaxID=151549 RepID=A0A4C1ZH30_EUMVA|nr:hypothetical protein EVAR_99861_1 [Eumeta japonica]